MDAVRAWMRQWVRPRGPLPALRVGAGALRRAPGGPAGRADRRRRPSETRPPGLAGLLGRLAAHRRHAGRRAAARRAHRRTRTGTWSSCSAWTPAPVPRGSGARSATTPRGTCSASPAPTWRAGRPRSAQVGQAVLTADRRGGPRPARGVPELRRPHATTSPARWCRRSRCPRPIRCRSTTSPGSPRPPRPRCGPRAPPSDQAVDRAALPDAAPRAAHRVRPAPPAACSTWAGCCSPTRPASPSWSASCAAATRSRRGPAGRRCRATAVGARSTCRLRRVHWDRSRGQRVTVRPVPGRPARRPGHAGGREGRAARAGRPQGRARPRSDRAAHRASCTACSPRRSTPARTGSTPG